MDFFSVISERMHLNTTPKNDFSCSTFRLVFVFVEIFTIIKYHCPFPRNDKFEVMAIKKISISLFYYSNNALSYQKKKSKKFLY